MASRKINGNGHQQEATEVYDLRQLEALPLEDIVYGQTTVLRMSQIRSDPMYQRELNQKLVKQISENFQPELFAALLVNQRRDGTYWLVDGQHRTTGLRLRDPQFDHRLACQVVHVGGQAEEARLFAILNSPSSRRVVRHSETVKTRLLNQDGEWAAIDAIVRKAGFSLQFDGTPAGSYKDWRGISQTQTLERLYRFSHDVLAETLWFIDRTWGGSQDSTRSDVLLGVASFLTSVRDHKNVKGRWDPIIHCLKAIDVRSLRQFSKNRMTSAKGGPRFAEAMIVQYNERNKKKSIAPVVSAKYFG